jgi:hypothetical protein
LSIDALSFFVSVKEPRNDLLVLKLHINAFRRAVSQLENIFNPCRNIINLRLKGLIISVLNSMALFKRHRLLVEVSEQS